VPAWAKTMAVAAATQAAQAIELSELCDWGDDDACDTLSQEEEAKSALLAELNAVSWSDMAAAATAAAAVAAEASQAVRGEGTGDDGTARSESEEDAKRALLAKLDVPSGAGTEWGTGPSDTSAAPAPPMPMNADALLGTLDAPAWSEAAGAITDVINEAARMEALTEACGSGDDVACKALSREDAAKRAWLAKIDVATWDDAAKVITAMAEEASDQESMLTRACEAGDDEACQILARGEEAKKAWLAKLDAPDV